MHTTTMAEDHASRDGHDATPDRFACCAASDGLDLTSYAFDAEESTIAHDPDWQLAAEPSDAMLKQAAAFATIDWHLPFRRLILSLPAHVRATLTADQLDALSLATRPQQAPHQFQYRISFPFLWRRYYLALFFGRERRSLSRLLREGQISAQRTSIVMLAGLSLLVGVSVLTTLASLYLAKSLLGIDLIDGPSVLHGLFY